LAGDDGLPWLTDFSFSELAATPRQKDLDLAELLASLAILTSADRAVSSAAAVIGAPGLAPAVPLLQPLALSAATRHAITREDGLLAATRSAAVAASGLSVQPLAPPAAGRGEAMSSEVTRAARRAPRPALAETLR